MSKEAIRPGTMVRAKHEENKNLEAITEKAIGGDKEALCMLCEEIAKSVLFRAKYILNNESDAEDVAQEVLIRVCENIGSLRSPKALKAWLGGIIMNESNRHIAKNMKKRATVDIDDYIESFEDDRDHIKPQGYVENVETRVAIMEILRNLPVRQREAVILHYYDELSVVEVAQAMGITKQNASKYLSLAREKLKNDIENAPVGSKLSAMAAVPVGAMIAETICAEAVAFAPANAAWAGGVVVQCQTSVAAQPVAVEGAKEILKEGGKNTTGVIAAVVAACIAGSVLLGVAVGGTPTKTATPMLEAHMEGSILFSGGQGDSDSQYSHVNPRRAEPQANSSIGEVSILYWWIEDIASGAVLHSGYSENVDNTLSQMIDNGYYGEYNLFFRIKDEIGSIFRLGSNFFVEPTAETLDI